MKKNHVPIPVDTQDVKLPKGLIEMGEEIARNVHDVWAQSRIAEGWRHGQEADLGKVKKHGKAYEQIINCLSAVYTEDAEPKKTQWLMGVIAEHNTWKLQQDCNDYKCKLDRAYYLIYGDEVKTKQHLGEAMNFATEKENIVMKEIVDSLGSKPDVKDGLSDIKGALEGKSVIYDNLDPNLLLEERDLLVN